MRALFLKFFLLISFPLKPSDFQQAFPLSPHLDTYTLWSIVSSLRFHLMWDFLFEVLYFHKNTQRIRFHFKGVIKRMLCLARELNDFHPHEKQAAIGIEPEVALWPRWIANGLCCFVFYPKMSAFCPYQWLTTSSNPNEIALFPPPPATMAGYEQVRVLSDMWLLPLVLQTFMFWAWNISDNEVEMYPGCLQKMSSRGHLAACGFDLKHPDNWVIHFEYSKNGFGLPSNKRGTGSVRYELCRGRFLSQVWVRESRPAQSVSCLETRWNTVPYRGGFKDRCRVFIYLWSPQELVPRNFLEGYAEHDGLLGQSFFSGAMDNMHAFFKECAIFCFLPFWCKKLS